MMIETRTPQRVKARTKGVTGYASVMRPTKYANPFDFRTLGRQLAVEQYRQWIAETDEGRAIASQARIELRGRDLGCTCPLDGHCHGNVLLEIANATSEADTTGNA
jgi:hypothetical protein